MNMEQCGKVLLTWSHLSIHIVDLSGDGTFLPKDEISVSLFV